MPAKTHKAKLSFSKKVSLIFLGLFLALIILEISLRLGGFITLSLQEKNNLASLKQKGTYRIMCLGESTTSHQYPPFLEEFLNKQNIGIKFSVIDKGIPGTNTMFILDQLESNIDKYKPDMVITMMGINDFGSHMPVEDYSDSKIMSSLQSLKVYKLVKLIYLHFRRKSEEENFSRPKQDNTAVEKQQNDNSLSSLDQDILDAKDNLQAKEVLNKSLALNSQDADAYIELGGVYWGQGKLIQAEELFKKAIELNPKNDYFYIQLGILCRDKGEVFQAEEAFKKAISIDSEDAEAYIELGLLFRRQGRFFQAKKVFKKVSKLKPKNVDAYIELGLNYLDQGEVFQAEEAFKKAIELNPKDDWAYIELGRVYWEQGRFPQAEALFQKAVAADPQDVEAYFELGITYQEQGKFSQAEEAFRKAIAIDSEYDRAYGALYVLYKTIGDFVSADKYLDKAYKIRLGKYDPVTANSYHKLKSILDQRNIQLVCVQYPMRNIKPLKNIFQEKADDIIFVDNEKIFKEALSASSYKEYFVDMFGGDFGHCTDKGNRLLAENVGEVILKKMFGR